MKLDDDSERQVAKHDVEFKKKNGTEEFQVNMKCFTFENLEELVESKFVLGE